MAKRKEQENVLLEFQPGSGTSYHFCSLFTEQSECRPPCTVGAWEAEDPAKDAAAMAAGATV